MKFLIGQLLNLIAASVAALSLALAYTAIDLGLGQTLTWPMILISWWVAWGVLSNELREQAKKDGVL